MRSGRRAFARPGWVSLAGALVLAALRPVSLAAAEPPCPASHTQHLDLHATRTALTYNEAVTIVAFGSSSTEGIGATIPARAYPARLEAWLRARWPGSSIRVLNRGIGGQTAHEMLARLDADVLAAKPTLVIWQVGANAALRGLDPVAFATFLSSGTKRILASGADLVLMDNQIAPKIQRVVHSGTYREILARAAASRGASVFSRTALMQEWRKADPSAHDMIGPDGLHHTDRGYACLAASLGRAINDAVGQLPVTVTAGVSGGAIRATANR